MSSLKKPIASSDPQNTCASLTLYFLILKRGICVDRLIRVLFYCFYNQSEIKKVIFNDGKEKNVHFQGTVDQLCSPSSVISVLS